MEIENESETIGPQNKKRRLLIGKNVEKLPDISYSTLEPVRSQLNSIIADATQQMKMHDELEQLKNVASSTESSTQSSLENKTKTLPVPSGEILTVNGNLMNGVILTMNNNLANKTLINSMSANTSPLNIITPVCTNNMSNNNLINFGNPNVNGQPIFVSDFIGGSHLNVNNNAALLNLIKSNMNANNQNNNSLPVIITSNSNSNMNYSNIMPKPPTYAKISPCPAGYLKNALLTNTNKSQPSKTINNNNDNVYISNNNVNRRTKNNICNLIPMTNNSLTAVVNNVAATTAVVGQPVKSNESTDEESSKKRRNTIKSIFDKTQNPVEKKFRNSRVVTIDPPDPAIAAKLNELALVKDTNKQDVHDEISDMFNLTEDQSKSNVKRSSSNLEELIRKNLSPPKSKSKEVMQNDAKNSTPPVTKVVKQEPKDYSDQEESDTTSANDEDSDDSDYELVLQLNRDTKNLIPNKNVKNNSSLLNDGNMNGKSKKANEAAHVKTESCLNANNRSLRSRTTFNRT